MCEVHDFYVSQINNLVTQGRESLIDGLVADYDRLCREIEIPRKAA